MPGNPIGESPEPEEPGRDAPAAIGASVPVPAAEVQSAPEAPDSALTPDQPSHDGSPSPAPQPKSRPQRTQRHWPLRRKILVPIALALLGIALLGLGLKLIPSRKVSPPPTYDQIIIQSTVPLSVIDYNSTQISSSIDRLGVSVFYDVGNSKPHVPIAGYVVLRLPTDLHFSTCPVHECLYNSADQVSSWDEPFTFKVSRSLGALEVTASVDLFVKVYDFGEAYNGVTAAVALPQVNYMGPGTPTLATRYNIPSAKDYDWTASYLPTFSNESRAIWLEPTSDGEVQNRSVVGINYANQGQDSRNLFISGVILGLAGAALLSGVQEALHAND